LRNFALRRLDDGTASFVIDDHRRVEPANLRLRAIEMLHSRLPLNGIDGLSRGPRLPQIDAANVATILAAQIIFTHEPTQPLIYRRSAIRRLAQPLLS
jgi:hypothetical protein